jgi:hypothetical protein
MTSNVHSLQNSQCDLNMYGPDPGDGSVKCTCDEDAPIEPSTAPATSGPARALREVMHPEPLPRRPAPRVGRPEDVVITLSGRQAQTHIELQEAGREMRAAQDLYRKAEQRYRAALDAHMQEIQ